MWGRIHLIPVMQAEEDRDQVRRYLADQAREKELLGTNSSPYHGDRWVKVVQELCVKKAVVRGLWANLGFLQVCTTDFRYYSV